MSIGRSYGNSQQIETRNPGVLKSEQELGGKDRSGVGYVYQVEGSRKEMATRRMISRHDRNPAWLKYWLQQRVS